MILHLQAVSTFTSNEKENKIKNISSGDIMRNLTVRFERTKLVRPEEGDQSVYDVSDAGELIMVGASSKFFKCGEEEPPEVRELVAPHDVSGKCVSLIDNVAAFSCGSVVSWDWTAAFSEGAEVVGNVVRIVE